MVDGFLEGLIGGLLGQPAAQWLSRYRYRVIFVAATLATHIGIFVAGAYAKGLRLAIQVTLEKTFTAEGILAPMGIGLLTVLMVVVGSLNAPKEPIKKREKAGSDDFPEK